MCVKVIARQTSDILDAMYAYIMYNFCIFELHARTDGRGVMCNAASEFGTHLT